MQWPKKQSKVKQNNAKVWVVSKSKCFPFFLILVLQSTIHGNIDHWYSYRLCYDFHLAIFFVLQQPLQKQYNETLGLQHYHDMTRWIWTSWQCCHVVIVSWCHAWHLREAQCTSPAVLPQPCLVGAWLVAEATVGTVYLGSGGGWVGG